MSLTRFAVNDKWTTRTFFYTSSIKAQEACRPCRCSSEAGRPAAPRGPHPPQCAGWRPPCAVLGPAAAMHARAAPSSRHASAAAMPAAGALRPHLCRPLPGRRPRPEVRSAGRKPAADCEHTTTTGHVYVRRRLDVHVEPPRSITLRGCSRRYLPAPSPSPWPWLADADDDVVRVAAVGDLVSLHYVCKLENGEASACPPLGGCSLGGVRGGAWWAPPWCTCHGGRLPVCAASCTARHVGLWW